MIIYYFNAYRSLNHYNINGISFPSLFPEDQALKNIDNITTCINCMEYGVINDIFVGPCANCVGNFDNKCGKGFISWGKELRTKSTDHISSVFDTYLKPTNDIKNSMKHTDALTFIIDRLVYCLIEKHGSEKEYDINDLATYLYNLRGNLREALSRIYDANNLPTTELYDRNWSEMWRPWASIDALCSSSEEEENRRVPYQDVSRFDLPLKFFDSRLRSWSVSVGERLNFGTVVEDFEYEGDFEDNISELSGNDFDFDDNEYNDYNDNFWTPQEQEQIEQIMVNACNK